MRYAYYVLHVDAGDDTSYVPGGVGEGEGQKGRKRHKSSSVRLLYCTSSRRIQLVSAYIVPCREQRPIRRYRTNCNAW